MSERDAHNQCWYLLRNFSHCSTTSLNRCGESIHFTRNNYACTQHNGHPSLGRHTVVDCRLAFDVADVAVVQVDHKQHYKKSSVSDEDMAM